MLRLAAALALAGLWIASGAESQQSLPPAGVEKPVDAPDANQQAKSDKRGSSELPFVVEIIPTKKSKEDIEYEANERDAKTREAAAKERLDTDLVKFTGELASYTFGLFIATVVLVIATTGLLVAGVYQTRLLRTEFIASHRPRLRVYAFEVADRELPENQPVSILFVAHNIGETNARITKIVGTVVFWRSSAPLEPNIRLNLVSEYNLVLESGEREQFGIDAPIEGSHRSAVSIQDGRTPIYCIGRITYLDDNKVERETGFCRKITLDPYRTETVAHPDYEYDY